MRKTVSGLTVCLILIISIIFSYPEKAYAGEQIFPTSTPKTETIFEESFEEGFGMWAPLGGLAELELDDSSSKKGGYSLKVSKRQATWSGPSVNITECHFKPGKLYTFVAWVKHSQDNELHTISWTIQSKNKKGEPVYTPIGSVNANSKGWDRIEAAIDFPEDIVESTMYFESNDIDLSFNIDAIVITGEKEADVSSESDKNQPDEFLFGFEEGTDKWKARGNETVERSSNFSYLGRYSLYTSERTKFWNGPIVDISALVKTKLSYEYSAYVMYNGRAYENEHDFILELRYILDGKENYVPVDSKTLQKGNWSKLCGQSEIPEGASGICLLVQTANIEEGEEADANDLMAFYIDNVQIIDSTVENHRRTMNAVITAVIISVSSCILVLIAVIFIRKFSVDNHDLAAAIQDSMTGALNRNSFEIQIAHLENRPDETRKKWITTCDVNFLKTINDNYGHQKGDDAILRCAKVLLETIGKKGTVYRTGGDEFVCITRNDMSELIKQAMDLEAQHYAGYPFSVAVGAAAYSPELDGTEPDIKLILGRSDREMYIHKEAQKKDMQNMM